ncbi:retrovirus-related pol polyprotein from transposon TNT 1-94 [Tanacetum coccineum]|uniref:Retrovirus-related pol polyprotein from transposon TNT 1-94 n=1 Tax=Tanacetum coccineum TaxID=301880 RepID=A0ABQ4XTC4_9ASTR
MLLHAMGNVSSISTSQPICLGVDLEPDEWIEDSGCSKHMTGNRKLFSTYKAYNGGNIIFGSNLRDNIIGKGQICDNKCRVTFSEHDSEITKDGKVIGREPKNVNEALTDDSWIVAMQEELNQFIANEVWELVPQSRNMTLIGTKWVFRNKLDENGIVSRNKASAFLNGFINKKVYVAQPPGFIDFEKPDHVYKLKKALYGLKQTPKAWYDRLIAFLIKREYKMEMLDLSRHCDEFAKIMHDEFEMIKMGELNFFFGLQIKEMEDGIFFNQSKYIKEVLKKFDLEEFKPMKTPMSSDTKLTKDEEYKSVDSTKYRGMIEFAQILDIPCEGACVFTDKWSLDELAYGVPTDGPYQTNPPSPDDIISYIRIDREGQVTRIRHEQEIDVHDHQILTREIVPTLKPLEEIIRENVFCLGGNRDHTKKDHGTGRGRHFTSSSSAFDQPSSSHLNDDDDGNDEGTSRVSTPSPTRFVNSLTNDVPQVFQNPPNIDPHMEPFYTRQTKIINCQVQIRDEHRGRLRSIGKGLRNL